MCNKIILLLILNLLVLVANICWGSVHIPLADIWASLSDGADVSEGVRFIVLQSRLPAALTALITGSALGVCGLLLQSYFRNPLAGPSILGITNGANLMVALIALCGWGGATLAGHLTLTVLASLLGAFAILGLLLAIGHVVRTQVTLFIVGMLLSYLTSAFITLLSYQATAQGLQQLMLWGMGSFNGVSLSALPLYATLLLLTLSGSLWLIKPLNGWMLGEQYAQSLGFSIRRTRWMLLLISGLLAAITTAWTGPIAFVGLSMPHVARMLMRTDNHLHLLPASLLLGALCCSICLLLSTLPSGGTLLPINALTPLFGIPVILYVLLRR